MPKSLLKKLKDKCWKLASEYNRRKDVDQYGYGNCCTCGKRLHWKEGDAGHFMAGRGNAVLFYDKGIHLQCKRCNGPGSGEQYLYSRFIEKRYGQDEVKKQERMRHEIRKIEIPEYERMIEEYKSKIESLESR